jgi:hypothetical protein
MSRLLSLTGLPLLIGLLAHTIFAADAGRMLDKYLRRTAAAQQDYVEGMQNPRRDPVQAALAAAGKWGQRMQEAIQAGSYAAGVRNQDRPAALQAAIGDGGAAYAAGIAKREGKISTAFQQLAPRLNAISQNIQAMPQDTPQQREQRMVRNLQLMRELGKQLRGRSGSPGV